MTAHTTDMDVLELQPYRMPTDILAEIDALSGERRQLLQKISDKPQDPALRRRMAEIDERLEELWLQRRMELRRTG